MAVTLVQNTFRIRTDNTAAQGGTPVWAAAQGTNANITIGLPFRIRFLIQNTGSTSPSTSVYTLNCSRNSGAYAAVTTTGTYVRSQDATVGASADNSAISTAILTGGTGTFTNGQYDDTGSTATFVMTHGDYTVLEFAIQFTSSVATTDTYAFRVYESTTAFTTYTATPTISPLAGAITLVYDGLGPLVEGTNGVAYGSTTASIPAGSNIFLFVAGASGSGAAPTAFVDSAGNNYTQAVAETFGGVTNEVSVWSCPNCLALSSGGTITGTQASGGYYAAIAFASGYNGGVEGQAGTTATATSASVSTGSLSLSGELVLAFMVGGPSLVPIIEPAGFASIASTAALNSVGMDIAYIVAPSTSSVTYSPSGFTSQAFGVVIAAFKLTQTAITAYSGAALECLGTLTSKGIAALETLTSDKALSAPSAETEASLKCITPPGGEVLAALTARAAALDEILFGAKTSASGQGELLGGSLALTAAVAELKGLALVTAAAALQAEIIASQKGSYLAEDEAMLSLKRNTIEAAEALLSAKSAAAAQGEEIAGLARQSASQGELVASQKGEYLASDELLPSLKRAAAEAVEIILGMKLASPAQGETTAALASRTAGEAEQAAFQHLSRPASTETTGKLVSSQNLAAEVASSLLGRALASDEVLHGLMANVAIGDEYALGIAAQAVAFGELLGVTLTYFNSAAAMETVAQSRSKTGAAEEAAGAVLRRAAGEVENTYGLAAAQAAATETLAKLLTQSAAAAEKSFALARVGASDIELVHGLAKAADAAMETLGSIQGSSAATAESGARLAANVAAGAEAITNALRTIATTQELLVGIAASMPAALEEVGLMQAFLSNSAMMLEVMAQRLAAWSRATDTASVLALAFDAPAIAASAGDEL